MSDKFDPNDIDVFVNLTNERQRAKKTDTSDIDVFVNLTSEMQRAKKTANKSQGAPSPAEQQQTKIKVKQELTAEKRKLLKRKLKRIIAAIAAGTTIVVGTITATAPRREKKDKIEKGTKILVDACEENLLAWGLGKKENGKFEIGENSISDYQVLEADSPIEVYGYKIAIDDYEEFNKFIQSVTYENGLYNYIDYGQFLRVNGYYEQGSTETSNAVFENMMEASILTAYENGTINSYVENEFYTNDLNNTNKNR